MQGAWSIAAACFGSGIGSYLLSRKRAKQKAAKEQSLVSVPRESPRNGGVTYVRGEVLEIPSGDVKRLS